MFIDAALGGGIAGHRDMTVQMIFAEVQDDRRVAAHMLRGFELET